MTDETPSVDASRTGVPALPRPDATVCFVALVSAAVLTVSKYHASTGEYADLFGRYGRDGGAFAAAARALHFPNAAAWLATVTGPVADHLYWFGTSMFLFVAAPLVLVRLTPGVYAREFGIGAGDWRFGLKAWAILFAVMLPILILASRATSFNGQYPMCSGATSNGRALIVYEIAYLSYFVGWEFVYRGMLCNGLYPRIGFAAVLLQSIPFGIMHAGKPELEAYGSIIAAVALGWLAVRTRSFWYGCGLHATVALAMDVVSMTQSHRWPKVW